ncbi:nucleotidyltransferase family protein [Cytobacillus massiliigabonensis]|uniref:nucleotidyltransferase family protein n=1 Tax=Cytobacillus massiliigabonensis TaxID=1871011 RepID=UPI000C81D6A9|nr:nucleotidyltransferase family protein [Cytobacillus massiliigabonensis]
MKEKIGYHSVSAIILAAGMSTRMGQLKQLLLLNRRPLLIHVIEAAASVDFFEIITVIGCQASKIQKEILIDDRRFCWAINEKYEAGQSSSLKTGILNVGEKSAGVMVFLGDLPFILHETILKIYRAGVKMMQETTESFIIQPEYEGKPGHPVFIGNFNREIMMQLHGDTGAKVIMDKFSIRKRMAVNDIGILFDVDTPETYLKAKSFNK